MQRTLSQRGLLLAGAALLWLRRWSGWRVGPARLRRGWLKAQKAVQDQLAEAIRALRSGALFVLVVTSQLGIGLAGIAGVLVMGLGTGLVTVAVAVLAVWSCEGVLAGLGWGLDAGAIAHLLPVLELVIGAFVTTAALGLLVGAL